MNGLTYADFLRLMGNPNQGSEGSSAVMSEAQWNGMDDRERYKNISAYGALEADPAMKAAFEAKFGPMKSYENSGAERDSGGKLIWGYGTPQIYDSNASEYAQDPSRILYNPDGTWARESSNVRGDFMAGQQKASADSGYWKGDKWDGLKSILPMVAAFAAPYAVAALGGEAAGGAAAGTGAFDVGASTGFGGIGEGWGLGEGVGAGAGAGAGSSGFPAMEGPGAFEGGSTPSLYGGAGATPAPFEGSLLGGGAGAGGGSSGGLFQQAGNWIAQNPLRAIGLLQSAGGLFGSHGGSAGSSGSGGSSGGSSKGGEGTAPPLNIPQPGNYWVNPYTQAQLDRSYGR